MTSNSKLLCLAKQRKLAYGSFWLLLILCGCSDVSKPIVAQSQGSRLEDAPPPAKEALYEYFSAAITPEQIEADLAEQIKEIESGLENVEADVKSKMLEMFEVNPHLVEAIANPSSASIAGDDPKSAGVTTAQLALGYEKVWEAIIADYEQHSKDPAETKLEIVALIRKVIIPVITDEQYDAESIERLKHYYTSGNIDPIVLLPLVLTTHKSSPLQVKIFQQLNQSLSQRNCSPLTQFIVLSSSASRVESIIPQECGRLAVTAIDSVAQVWQDHRNETAWFPYLVLLTRQAFEGINAKGKCDLTKRLLDIPDNDKPSFVNYLACEILLDAVASHARGAKTIDRVAKDQLDIFSDFTERQTKHLLKAWTLAPEVPYFSRSLMHVQGRSSCTPFTTEEWYRICLVSHIDSRLTTNMFSTFLQPRWGGSMQQLQQYSKLLVQYAAQNPKHRLLWNSPVLYYLSEESFLLNTTANSDFEEQAELLLDALDKHSGDKPDPRIDSWQAALIVHLLWDASKLDRLSNFWNRYQSTINDATLREFCVPASLVAALMYAYDEESKDSWQVVQKHLLVNTTELIESEFDSVEKALADVEEKWKSRVARESANAGAGIQSTDSAAGATSDEATAQWTELVNRLLQSLRLMHAKARQFKAGEEVDLIQLGKLAWQHSGSCKVTYGDSGIQVDANSRDKNLILYQPLKFEPPFVVELDVTQGVCDADPYGVALFVGPVAVRSTERTSHGRSLRYSPGYPMIFQDRLPQGLLQGEDYFEKQLWPVPKQATLKMEVTPDGTASYLNNVLLSRTDEPLIPRGFVGFGRATAETFTSVPSKPAQYKITALRIKRL